MPSIRILPDHVANQIAAGEVVERPSSVLKELVENALDAGARRIDVQWEEGGKRLLEVADDGCGMGRDDLYMALERHATSKVRTAEDLGHLASYGFRGEALPSIASVSRFEIHSAEEDGAGHRLRCEFGIIKEVLPASRARGATITVRDLFGQLPARRRFLKSTETENGHLWGVVTRLALASPQVHWTVRTDRSNVLNLPPVQDPGERLAPLLGEKFAELRGFSAGTSPWRMCGYLSSPELSFRNRDHLYLFVNGRSVRDRLLLAALANGWEGFFPKGAYPAVALFLELPPESVDVNVHPTKAEVRFREPHRVFPWVSQTTREAWSQSKGNLASILELPPKPVNLADDAPIRPHAPSHPHLWPEASREPHQAMSQAALDRPYRAQAVETPARESLTPMAEMHYLGAFDATYLLAEIRTSGEPELWIVDQHVAHERILYERLFLRRHAPAIQPLLPPAMLQLGMAALSRLAPFVGELNAVGIPCEIFGEDALVVRGLPDFLMEWDPETLVEDLLARLEQEGKADLDAFRRELNAELACRAAIKKHHHLSPDLAQALIRDLMACEVPHTCPHGRPVIKKLSRAELERSFGRRV